MLRRCPTCNRLHETRADGALGCPACTAPALPAVRRPPLIIEGAVLRAGSRPAAPAPRPFVPPRQLPRLAAAPPPAARGRMRGLAFGVALVLIVGVTVPIAAAIPGLAGLFAPREAVVLERVTSTTVIAGGEAALVVEGTLSNPSGRDAPVPFVRVALRDAGGEEAYAWTVEPSAMMLGPGASVSFRSALKNPVSGPARVVVSLVPREQRIGMR